MANTIIGSPHTTIGQKYLAYAYINASAIPFGTSASALLAGGLACAGSGTCVTVAMAAEWLDDQATVIAASQGDPQAVAQIQVVQALTAVPDPIPNYLFSQCDNISALGIRNYDEVMSSSNDLAVSGGRGSIPRSPDDFGNARGLSSGRLFFIDEIGIPIRNLSADNVRITTEGVDVVEFHLSRFEPYEDNTIAITRLRAILTGELEPTPYDLNFYTHELREYVRYRYLGYETGQPANAYHFWNNLHTATLEDYGLSDEMLYHPSITGE